MSSKTADTDSNGVSKLWELNIYELNRMPHEIIHDQTEIAVSPKILQNELMCPICLDILKNTMTTKECLHRFCHDCIITALRAGNKECPTCRKKLVSKRSLRPDPNFDGIISKIYPNREEYDALHEKVLEKLNKKHLTAIHNQNNGNSSATSQTKTATPRQQNRKASSAANDAHSTKTTDTNGEQQASTSNYRGTKRTVVNHSDDSDMESRTSTEQSSSMHVTYDQDEIEIILKPHPLKEKKLRSNRFLKTTCNATMNHLSKYLWTRLCVENNAASSSTNANFDSDAASNDFSIYSHSGDKSSTYHLLEANYSLENLVDKYQKTHKPIELFYSFKSDDMRRQNGTTFNENQPTTSSSS